MLDKNGKEIKNGNRVKLTTKSGRNGACYNDDFWMKRGKLVDSTGDDWTYFFHNEGINDDLEIIKK